MKTNIRSLAAVMIVILALSACNVNQSAGPTQLPTSAIHTKVAQTMIAEITQTAAAATSPMLPEPPADSPTSTETLVPSITPTLTLTATTTLAAEDVRNTLGNPSWVDTFENDNNWSLYDDAHSRFAVEDGRMVMTAHNADYWESWAVSWPVLENFYLEMTVQTGDACSGLDRYGMIVRAPDPSEGYLFAFACDGRYSLRIWDGAQYNTLVDWTSNGLIQAGPNQTNRLGFMAKGNKITLYGNGVKLTELTDNTYASGRFGPIIGAANTPGFTVWVDEFAYWVLP